MEYCYKITLKIRSGLDIWFETIWKNKKELQLFLQVVQIYISWLNQSLPAPIRQLAWFDRVTVPAGKAVSVKFTVESRSMALWLKDGWQITAGEL